MFDDEAYIPEGIKVDFCILSRDAAEKIASLGLPILDKNYIVISIHCSDQKPANLSGLDQSRILTLQFDDIEAPYSDLIPFDNEMAKEIIDFVNEKKPDMIIVHCLAGVCRSAAVAAALSRMMTNEDDWIFKQKVPNMLVYKTILETYYCNHDKHHGEYIQDCYMSHNAHKFKL